MPIVIELRPKYQELRAKKIYTHAEVINLLCEFAQVIYAKMPPEQIRKIVEENF